MLLLTPRQATRQTKDLYDTLDGTIDEDITEEQIKEFNDAVTALQPVATETSINALKSAITADQKGKSSRLHRSILQDIQSSHHSRRDSPEW